MSLTLNPPLQACSTKTYFSFQRTPRSLLASSTKISLNPLQASSSKSYFCFQQTPRSSWRRKQKHQFCIMSVQSRYSEGIVELTDDKDPRLIPEIITPSTEHSKIKFDKITVVRHPDTKKVYVHRVVMQRLMLVLLSDVKLPSTNHYYRDIMTEKLSSLGIPVHEQTSIIQKIFREIEVMVPGEHIMVNIFDHINEAPELCEMKDAYFPYRVNGKCIFHQKGFDPFIWKFPNPSIYDDDIIPTIEILDKIRDVKKRSTASTLLLALSAMVFCKVFNWN